MGTDINIARDKQVSPRRAVQGALLCGGKMVKKTHLETLIGENCLKDASVFAPGRKGSRVNAIHRIFEIFFKMFLFAKKRILKRDF